MNETPAQRIARVRGLEENYVCWFEYYFPNFAKVPCAWFHKKMAEDIVPATEVYELLEIYRSGAKSVHADMGIPLYLMFTGRMSFMLLIGETERKAQRLLSACQAQLQYNKRLINDYGNRYQQGDWSAGEFLTTDGVRFMCLGFGQDRAASARRNGAQTTSLWTMWTIRSTSTTTASCARGWNGCSRT